MNTRKRVKIVGQRACDVFVLVFLIVLLLGVGAGMTLCRTELGRDAVEAEEIAPSTEPSQGSGLEKTNNADGKEKNVSSPIGIGCWKVNAGSGNAVGVVAEAKKENITADGKSWIGGVSADNNMKIVVGYPEADAVGPEGTADLMNGVGFTDGLDMEEYPECSGTAKEIDGCWESETEAITAEQSSETCKKTLLDTTSDDRSEQRTDVDAEPGLGVEECAGIENGDNTVETTAGIRADRTERTIGSGSGHRSGIMADERSKDGDMAVDADPVVGGVEKPVAPIVRAVEIE